MRRSGHLQGKGSTFISPLVKTPSTSPALGIEPMTSCSAVKRSTNWANPAMVTEKFHWIVLTEKFQFNMFDYRTDWETIEQLGLI